MNASEIRSLLSDSPEFETALEALLDIDRERKTWTFDDIPLDSGTFGELVGEGVVEKVDGEYRLADPEAVERALGGETVEADDSGGVDVSMPELDWTAAGLLGLVLVVAVAVRIANYPSVFRDRVVFTGNDPYYYVYAVEEGLRNGWSFSELPAGLANGEPLTIVQLLYAAEFAGGLDSHTAILAWMPVLVGVATVLVTYLFAYEVAEDRRVALASAFVLAVLPVHVLRTALGFVDHHAFDFLWLVVTALGLVRAFKLDAVEVNRETVSAVVPLGVGVAGGVLAWWAGTLLLIPIPVTVIIGGTLAVRDSESFVATGTATALGVGLGAAIILFTHLTWGWHDLVIVAIPAVVALGSGVIVGATALWSRIGAPSWTLPSAVLVGLTGVVVAISQQAPEDWGTITGQLTRLFGSEEIAEVQSIFDATTMGWLFSFGLVFFFIVPAMVWGVYRLYRGDRRWLVASSYAWIMLGLAGVQARYAGEFSPFAALFGGVAVIYVAERVEAIEPTALFGGTDRPLLIPDRSAAIRIAAVVLLICGLSIVMAPIAADNVAIPHEQYETAAFLSNHAEAHDYEYPRSYVFSPWSWNRMYNYRVNGESESYGFAQANYRNFTFYQDPTAAYESIENRQVNDAYLVTEPIPRDAEVPTDTMQSRLHDRLGSRGDGVSGVGHYRALYVSDSGDYKAFRVVDGAMIRGGADPDSTVRLATDVEIEGASFTYSRQAAVEDGEFTVRVPYPGSYRIEGAADTSATVDESDVVNGQTVEVDDDVDAT